MFHTGWEFLGQIKISEEPMEDLSLCIMTRALCHELYKGWENDPAIYMDMSLFAPYRYER